MKTLQRVLPLLLLGLACRHAPATATQPETVEQATQTLRQLEAARPLTFRFIHQVAAHYGPQSFVMTGYLLGQRDGAFRVTALAALGPKLFDVARVNGAWQSRVYLPQLEKQLDVRHIGRAVERIYLLGEGMLGPLHFERGAWVSSGPVENDDEVDAVEVTRAVGTLGIVKKRFTSHGREVQEIFFDHPEQVDGHPFARHVRLVDARGFSLELQVTDYRPAFPMKTGDLNVLP